MNTFHPKAERTKLRRGWKTDQPHDLELTVIETEKHRSMYSYLITVSPFHWFPETRLPKDNQDESTPDKATPEDDPEREPLPPFTTRALSLLTMNPFFPVNFPSRVFVGTPTRLGSPQAGLKRLDLTLISNIRRHGPMGTPCCQGTLPALLGAETPKG